MCECRQLGSLQNGRPSAVIKNEKEQTISISGPPGGFRYKCISHMLHLDGHFLLSLPFLFSTCSSPLASQAMHPCLHHSTDCYRGLYLKSSNAIRSLEKFRIWRLNVPSAVSLQSFHMASSSVALEKDSSSVSKCATLPVFVLYS